ncbi:hypothetical protein Enr13x_71320 [Stieleria neptunia]|uniref:Uncharacterized protein n=1 Tax=Stieleria neptunia TaxID=2527979 RepID=A0A518I282_9BACT|nr:hypothetical protein Enr13x_71320 [Stieleria neptunia]
MVTLVGIPLISPWDLRGMTEIAREITSAGSFTFRPGDLVSEYRRGLASYPLNNSVSPVLFFFYNRVESLDVHF